jgi:hypothetical protein
MLLNCTHLFAQQKQKADTASKEISQNAFPHRKMAMPTSLLSIIPQKKESPLFPT